MTLISQLTRGPPLPGGTLEGGWGYSPDGGYTRAGGNVGNVGTTDEDGRFVWAGCFPGVEHNLWLSKPGYACARSAFCIAESGETLPEETVVLYPSSGIEGVALLEDGTPIAAARLGIRALYEEDRSTYVSSNTDAAGAFSVLEGIPATTVTLQFEILGFNWQGSTLVFPISVHWRNRWFYVFFFLAIAGMPLR